MPHFFIIGERKCGTSSLFRYLMMHPDLLPGIRKEPDYFSGNQGFTTDSWMDYVENFPLADTRESATLLWPELDSSGTLFEEEVQKPRIPGKPYFTGEASANTFHLGDPADLFRHLPDIRLLIMLRNPVDRAFSHHRMYLRFQQEGRDLGRHVGTFEEEIQAEMQLPSGGEFLAPGRYLDNLRRWDQVFPSEQLLVLFMDELASLPQKIMDQVLDHLGLPSWTWPEDSLEQRFNQAPSAKIEPSIRQSLMNWYETADLALADYLGRPIPWRS